MLEYIDQLWQNTHPKRLVGSFTVRVNFLSLKWFSSKSCGDKDCQNGSEGWGRPLTGNPKETFSSFALCSRFAGAAHCGFNLNFLKTKEVDYLFICLLTFGSPLCTMAVQVFCPLRNIRLLEFIGLIFEISLYILDMSTLLVLCVAIFSPALWLPFFPFLIACFDKQKCLILI